LLALALNYIPFIGPFVATLLPGLFALAQLDSWQTIALVFLGLTAIQFMIGNYLEPLVAGAALTISPFAVVFAVFFWGFLWGIPGAFIGVPIMITIVTLCAQYPGSRWVATPYRANHRMPRRTGADRLLLDCHRLRFRGLPYGAQTSVADD
jgi:AI-2 transport protein TqsA